MRSDALSILCVSGIREGGLGLGLVPPNRYTLDPTTQQHWRRRAQGPLPSVNTIDHCLVSVHNPHSHRVKRRQRKKEEKNRKLKVFQDITHSLPQTARPHSHWVKRGQRKRERKKKRKKVKVPTGWHTQPAMSMNLHNEADFLLPKVKLHAFISIVKLHCRACTWSLLTLLNYANFITLSHTHYGGVSVPNPFWIILHTSLHLPTLHKTACIILFMWPETQTPSHFRIFLIKMWHSINFNNNNGRSFFLLLLLAAFIWWQKTNKQPYGVKK